MVFQQATLRGRNVDPHVLLERLPLCLAVCAAYSLAAAVVAPKVASTLPPVMVVASNIASIPQSLGGKHFSGRIQRVIHLRRGGIAATIPAVDAFASRRPRGRSLLPLAVVLLGFGLAVPLPLLPARASVAGRRFRHRRIRTRPVVVVVFVVRFGVTHPRLPHDHYCGGRVLAGRGDASSGGHDRSIDLSVVIILVFPLVIHVGSVFVVMIRHVSACFSFWLGFVLA
mmetsp:Transcript_40565/g.86387  ORF Transcript_40565/g.86387 Transcript_40565/m.86387 type:complete len:227 (-) Transcript_40565:9-689(-)